MKIFQKLNPLLILIIFSVGLLWPYSLSFQAAPIFSDTAGHPHQTSIEFLYNRGVVEGYPDGSFGPDREINRAEIMKIILEASVEEDIGHRSICFPDVRGDWYAKYVCYAKEKGIIEGYPDGKFKPAQNVNTAEALKMGIESYPVSLGSANNPWYQKYIDFSHNNNIFSRYSILPQKNMTRGEMAYLIHQLMLDKEGTKKFTGVRNSKSAGCGKSKPSSKISNVVVNGLTRNFITVIPSGYSKDTPIKFIFAPHGRTNSNEMVRGYYKVEQASNGKAIIVYPSGLPEQTSPRNWSDAGNPSDQLRDFALFDKIIEEFTDSYCIDLDHIYVVGHSLGAWFTNTLSCARGNVIRAIGSVGGGTTINNCAGPVAAMVMHNPADRLAPFSSGETARDQLIGQNQCGSRTVSTSPSSLNCVAYQDCNEIAPLIWCPHSDSSSYNGSYYPHTWPDGAGSEIWKFFESLED